MLDQQLAVAEEDEKKMRHALDPPAQVQHRKEEEKQLFSHSISLQPRRERYFPRTVTDTYRRPSLAARTCFSKILFLDLGRVKSVIE